MNDSNKEKIEQVLSDLFNQYRFVFWYDKGGIMNEWVTSLDIDGVEQLPLDNNAFSLKYRMLKGEQPVRGFLIYSTKAMPADEDNWLLDIQQEGIIFSADMASLYAAECGIAMELKSKVVSPHIEFFQLADNRHKLAERISSSTSAADIILQMVAVVCRTESMYDDLTWALAEEAVDDKSDLQDKLALYQLDDIYWRMVEKAFGYQKARKIKDLIIVLFEDDLNKHFTESDLRNEAHIFMRDWRNNRQYSPSYQAWSRRLEQELAIKERIKEKPLDSLVQIDTFPCVDKVIAQYLEAEVKHETIAAERVGEIIDERQHKLFFDEAHHTLMALLEARRLFEEVEKKMTGLMIHSPEEGMQLYINELYTIDLHYRHYFKEAKQSESHKLLGEITEKVQRVYTNSYLLPLASKWQTVVDAMDKWSIENVLSQRNFYSIYVEPLLMKGKKMFVIISDAMRYETMKELENRIAGENRMEANMKNALLSTLPSYTQLGMAALLPHRELSYDKDVDEVFADGKSTKGTQNRTNVLCAKVARSLAITAADFLANNNGRTFIKDYDLFYIYSNKIDKIGDNKDSEGDVFGATEDELDNIMRVVNYIRSSNGSNILITSDHGYIYQDETLDETDFTDFKAVGETIINENRRFVIGKQLLAGDAVKTWQSEEVGLKKGVMVQTCKGLNRIRKQGSGSRFVHGGSMPQEVVVPVLHVNIKKNKDSRYETRYVDVDILNKGSRITTNQQTINFYQSEAAEDKTKGIKLRLGFYDSKGEILSDSVCLAFDSNSNDTTQREQKYTFKFKAALAKLNGQEVVLRMERQVENSDQFVPYKEVPYKVSVMFELEF